MDATTIKNTIAPLAKEAGKQFVLATAVTAGSTLGMLAVFPIVGGAMKLYEKVTDKKAAKNTEE